MQTLFALEITIFTMIVVGAVLSKFGLVNVEGRKAVSNLVIYVILPCNIFNSFLTAVTMQQLLDLLAVLLIATGVQFGALEYSKIRYHAYPEQQKVNIEYGLLISNAGFMGFPVAEGLLGSLGLLMASIYVIPQRIMMWTNGLAIYSGTTNKKRAFFNAMTHPCMVACILGLIVMIFNIRPIDVIVLPIQTLGRCNTAMSMMIVGFVIGEMKTKKLITRATVLFTIDRLLLIPFIVFIICLLLRISHEAVGTCTLLAAMPGAAMTSVMASKYDKDPEFAAQLVVFSTICSIPTVLLWGWILQKI
jgi:predicted permease